KQLRGKFPREIWEAEPLLQAQEGKEVGFERQLYVAVEGRQCQSLENRQQRRGSAYTYVLGANDCSKFFFNRLCTTVSPSKDIHSQRLPRKFRTSLELLENHENIGNQVKEKSLAYTLARG